MKTRITAGLVALAVLAMAFAAVAVASSGKGKLTGFTYNSSTKVGKLTLTSGKAKTSYKVPADTNCGVHKGQSGDQIPCKSLGKSKYHGKQVRVTWKKVGNSKVASLVVVDL
jgi:hypothetical protein